MQRNIAQPPKWKEPAQRDEIKLTLKVVTPMFGGGYKTREVDPICIIRPAAIRGQLRFWWRATVSAAFSSPADLFRAEEALWGSSEQPGKVSLNIHLNSEVKELVRIDKRESLVPKYISAILTQEPSQTEQRIKSEVSKRIQQESKKNKWDEKTTQKKRKEALVKELRASEWIIETEKDVLYPFVLQAGTTFTLVLSFNQEHLNDVAKSVKAFVLFGGVGGRTRRGHGTLESISLPNEVSTLRFVDVAPWFQGIKDPPLGCVSLNGARLYCDTKAYDDPLHAWSKSIEIFKNFRKAELPGNSRPPKGSGSHTSWPEPKMIRAMQATSSSSSIASLAFPRGQLGLPLSFKSTPNQWGFFGEADLSLKIGNTETSRLASPIIVKPVKLNGKWHAGILILNTTPIGAGQLQLSTKKSVTLTVDSTNAPASLWDGSTEVSFSHSYSGILDVLAEYLQTKAGWKQQEIDKL